MIDDRQWHQDKKVSIGLILSTVGFIGGLAVQTYVIGQWTGAMEERVSQVERRLEGFAQRSQQADRVIAEQGEDIAVLVEQIAGTNRSLDRLHAQIEATNALLRQLIADVASRGTR